MEFINQTGNWSSVKESQNFKQQQQQRNSQTYQFLPAS